MNISRLKKENVFVNAKIKICFSTGSISNQLSVYLFDANGNQNHILWEIHPSSHQNFDKTNDKIKSFVQDKVYEWEREEQEDEKLRIKSIKERECREETELQELINSF